LQSRWETSNVYKVLINNRLEGCHFEDHYWYKKELNRALEKYFVCWTEMFQDRGNR